MTTHARFVWMTVFISMASIKFQTAERQESGENYVVHGNSVSKNTKLCLTPECIKAAALLIENVDTRTDPCEDFYQFSCGGFLQRHLAGQSYVHVDTLLDERMKAQLRKLLFQPKSPHEPKAVHKMKDFYGSCVNEDRQKAVGIEPLKRYISDHGGWPVVLGDKWDDDTFNWQDASSEFVKENNREASLIGATYIPNYSYSHIPERFLLKVTDPYSPLYSMSGINSTYIKAQYNFIVGIANYLGAPQERAEEELREVMGYVQQSVALETSKLNSSCICTDDCESPCPTLSPLENDSNENETQNKQKLITVADLYNITDQVDWLLYFQKTYSSDISMDTKVIFDLTDTVIWKNRIDFLETLPKRAVANYLMWLGILQIIDSIDDPEINKLQATLNKEGHRAPGNELRWTKCLTDSNLYFNHALTWLYSNKYFTAGEKEGVTDMFNRIRMEFGETLDEVDWLSNETLRKAKDKLSTLKANIAYPQELLNTELLDNHYETLDIDSDKYFENMLSSMKFNFYKDAAMIGKNITYSHWSYMESVLYTNAFYYHSINAIAIPATQVRGIYYAQNRPMALNYGSLGSIVGHEIMHGFNELEDGGDPSSKVKWWKPEDSRSFLNRSKCIIEQYGKFGHPKTGQINGTQTLDENLADNAGLLYAYRAYQRWLNENGEEARLPGMDGFSPNQIFWLAFANSWCRAENRPLHLQIHRYLRHSLPKFRVLGAVSNSEEFSQDFQCPLGSAMNPPTKCSVW